MKVRILLPALLALSIAAPALAFAGDESTNDDDDATTLVAVASESLDAPAAAARLPAQDGKPGEKGGELGSLRRTLASAIVLKKLNLTSQQKRDLVSILADAKALRAKTKAQMSANLPSENERKQLLEKAIGEARTSGEVSADTKAQMQKLKGDFKNGASGTKDERKELHERFKNLFTPDQIAALKGIGKNGEAKGEGRGEGRRGGKMHGRKLLFRLMMSDEFSQELSR